MYHNPYVCTDPICFVTACDWIFSYFLTFEDTHTLHYMYISYFFNQPFNAQFYKLIYTYWLATPARFDAPGVILRESTI